MIEIDGSAHSGSGTLLRYAVALATLAGKPLHMTRIRARREKPGLRPQHLQAVEACRSLSGGRLEGAAVGAQEIRYFPGGLIGCGEHQWNIGSAGSTTLLAFTLLPLALYAGGPCRFSLTGGLFQDFAPSAFHLQHVLAPLLGRMGGQVKVEMVSPGYVPSGQGRLDMEVQPVRGALKPLRMIEQGALREIWGISLASHLEKEQVSRRMAARSGESLAERGLKARWTILEDRTARQRGAALFLRAHTDRECLLGADQAGRLGRRSEAIAEFVTASLLDDLKSGATVDRHLADQLILFAALAEGETEYIIPEATDHVAANLWLVDRILGARSRLEGRRLRMEGVGWRSQSSPAGLRPPSA